MERIYTPKAGAIIPLVFIGEKTMSDLKKIVVSAAELLPDLFGVNDTVHKKGSIRNEVTEYDLLIQDYIINTIKKEYPNAVFLGEEGGKEAEDTNNLLFVIDPIDGTTNFVNNCKFSCISIAMLRSGEVVEAVVYNPYLKDMFFAKKNEGAWLNDQKLQIEDTRLKESIVGYSNCPYDEEITDFTFAFGKMLYKKSLDFRRMGASALEICYAACGRYQLYCEMILYPWDYLAASLIVEEAGGVISDCSGGKLKINKRCSVVAGCPTAHHEVLEMYKDFMQQKGNDIKVKTSIND